MGLSDPLNVSQVSKLYTSLYVKNCIESNASCYVSIVYASLEIIKLYEVISKISVVFLQNSLF